MNENSERDKILSVLLGDPEHYISQIFSDVKDLKPSGKGFVGLCPFRSEKTPSFNVNVKDGNILYHCFGCEAGGDVFKYIQEIRGVDFVEALKELGEITGVEVNTKPLKPLDPFTAEIVKEAKKMNKETEDKTEKLEAAFSFSDTVKKTLNGKSKQTYKNYIEEIQKHFAGEHYKTGFSFLDETIKIRSRDFVIITGRTSHGKTSLMLNIALNILEYTLRKDDDKSPIVIYFTFEDSTIRLKNKMLNILGKKIDDNFDYFDIENLDPFPSLLEEPSAEENEKGTALKMIEKAGITVKEVEEKQEPLFYEKLDDLVNRKRLLLFDRGDFRDPELNTKENWTAFIAAVKNWTPEPRPIILFLDYLQIVPFETESKGWERMKEIAYFFEELAVKEGITILTGSQVNEEGQAREGRDIDHAASIVIDIFNRSHTSTKRKEEQRKNKDKDKDTEKTPYSYKAKENDKYAYINLSINKARYYDTGYRIDALSFDGYVFKDREKAEPAKVRRGL